MKVKLINLNIGEKFQDKVHGTTFTGEVIGYTEDGMVRVRVGGIASSQPPNKNVSMVKREK